MKNAGNLIFDKFKQAAEITKSLDNTTANPILQKQESSKKRFQKIDPRLAINSKNRLNASKIPV